MKTTLEDIKKTVAWYFKIKPEELDIPTRKEEICRPRQVAHFLARKYTKHCLRVIGESIGGKDHATVLHSCKTVKHDMETDQFFAYKVSLIDEAISLDFNRLLK